LERPGKGGGGKGGGGGGGVGRMREVGGLVGRRAVGRLGVSRSSPKKTWGQGWGKKKKCPQKEKN